MTEARTRDAARVIVLDEDDRVLLLRYDEGHIFWAVPGGALEPGETHAAAAVREIYEELGLEQVSIGPQLATRTSTHPIFGEQVKQVEKYFIARVRSQQVRPADATQTDNIRAWQWWGLDELAHTDQTVYPVGLADLILRYLKEGTPTEPVSLSA
ncbi:NUDIX hydrolase [Actinomadura opuntiae]|uniref:NUDIX hydrolase n=1 Tax=Actinomadura sp. OS1-43 TaxID=604315 RepID=UPI00255B39D6|nr:NUDIX domain-containing protein [Actinomadura sp. OS1-43]MDL4813068.1 NUDIX domain-containing protein [Actinomadura sp. OS1-43]